MKKLSIALCVLLAILTACGCGNVLPGEQGSTGALTQSLTTDAAASADTEEPSTAAGASEQVSVQPAEQTVRQTGQQSEQPPEGNGGLYAGKIKPSVLPDAKDSVGFYVYFVDVGQADCAVVICDGTVMLVDGGNTADSSRVVAVLKKLGAEAVDTVICTHAHEDHCGGLAGALNVFNVSQVFAPVQGADTKAYKNFIKGVQKQKLEVQNPVAGLKLYIGSALVIFHSPTRIEFEDLNNTSLVFTVEYGGIKVLFTGDAEKELEAAMLDEGAPLEADLLKVGHHGSETSSSYRFLRQVNPRAAVISVGEGNSYGHPADDTLSRFRDAEVQVLRTDENGDVLATVQDGALKIYTQK